MKDNRGIRLTVGTLTTLFLGLIYAWSIFVAPIEDDMGFTRAQTSMVFTISMSFFSIGNVAGGLILRKKSSQTAMIISAVLLMVGFTACSRINSLGGIYISYGVLASLGVGFSYIAILNVVTAWFRDKVGTASGILLMGFGLGSLILGGAASVLMNQFGWRTAFLVFGIAFGIIVFLSSILMTMPDERQMKLISDKHAVKEKSIDTDSIAAAGSEEKLELSAAEMVKRPAFILFFLWCALLVSAGLAVIGHAATFAASLGATTAVAVMATGVTAICNGAGRVVFGSLFDLRGRKLCMLLNSVTFIFSMIILLISSVTGSIVLLFAGYILTGFSYGGVPTLISAVINTFYGPKNYSVNFSIATLSVVPGAILGPFLAGVLVTYSNSYTSTFVVMLVICAIGLLISRFIRRP